MHSYSIYTGISHVNQLTKLRPALIRRIREELQDIALRHGGRPGPEDVFRFPPSLGETARKTAEAAAAMHAYLRQNDRELFGITVLVASEDDLRDDDENGGFHGLLLRVPDEDGLWVSPEVFGELQDYVVGSPEDDLIRISGLREAGPRLEERLPELLVRADRKSVV